MADLPVFFYNKLDAELLPRRPQHSHKGTFGRVLCVCGSEGMAGAAYFAAKAAYRMGCGLCKILTPDSNLPILATLLPEALLCGYNPTAPSMDTVAEAEEWADVLVIGCGMGVTPSSRRLLAQLLRTSKKPKILDADALHLLSKNPSLLAHTKGAILTPHAMELSRLTGLAPEVLAADPVTHAYEFSKKHQLVCVLKDHHTAVSDGSLPVYLNTSGNSGMATAGSGDVLAGLLGGLLAQCRDGSLDAYRCACLGVYLHGLCGDAAARSMTEYSVMASDLIDALPTVLKEILF